MLALRKRIDGGKVKIVLRKSIEHNSDCKKINSNFFFQTQIDIDMNRIKQCCAAQIVHSSYQH